MSATGDQSRNAPCIPLKNLRVWGRTCFVSIHDRSACGAVYGALCDNGCTPRQCVARPSPRRAYCWVKFLESGRLSAQVICLGKPMVLDDLKHEANHSFESLLLVKKMQFAEVTVFVLYERM